MSCNLVGAAWLPCLAPEEKCRHYPPAILYLSLLHQISLLSDLRFLWICVSLRSCKSKHVLVKSHECNWTVVSNIKIIHKKFINNMYFFLFMSSGILLAVRLLPRLYQLKQSKLKVKHSINTNWDEETVSYWRGKPTQPSCISPPFCM